jgi:ubiquinone/menaquinone biosynthesis C-methylase UbiE
MIRVESPSNICGSCLGRKMEIKLVSPVTLGELAESAGVLVDGAGNHFRVADGVPIFVEETNYADNFGLQWNSFAETQIDTAAHHMSSLRFWAETAWTPADLAGKRVLEVGSGAGRFTSVVLRESQASLASIDFSNAVRANKLNNEEFLYNGRLCLAQASIYEMPFPNDYFDRVFCLGVLQHTSNFQRSLHALYGKTKPGGELVVDFYPIKGWWTKINAKYILRPITKKLSHGFLLNSIRVAAPSVIKIYNLLHGIGLGALTRVLPICDINNTVSRDLDREEMLEHVVLDTFDMFSPKYDSPQKIATVAGWLSDCGAHITHADFIKYAESTAAAAVVRCLKPAR